MEKESKDTATEAALRAATEAFHAAIKPHGVASIIVLGGSSLSCNIMSRKNLRAMVGRDTRFDSVLPIFLEYETLTVAEVKILRAIGENVMDRFTEAAIKEEAAEAAHASNKD